MSPCTPPMIGGDVDVDDVAVLAATVVSGMPWQITSLTLRAQRLGEAAVAERRGVGAVVEQELVADPVELVGGDARGDVPRPTSARACAASRPATRIALDRLGVLDLAGRCTARAPAGRRTRGGGWTPGTARRGLIDARDERADRRGGPRGRRRGADRGGHARSLSRGPRGPGVSGAARETGACRTPGIAYAPGMEEPQFWFNVRTGQVEETANKSQSKDLLGPYPTRSEAERRAADRSRAHREVGRGGPSLA